MKKKVFYMGVVLLLFVFRVEGYFEHTYWCVLEDKTIQVSLSTGDQLCFEYMAWLTKLLQQSTVDLKSAQENAQISKSYDRTYREDVQKELTAKKNSLTEAQQKINLAMEDFEQELFIRVKWIVWYYLLAHTEEIEKKIDQWKTLSIRLLLLGNTKQYLFVRTQMNQRERELIFLHRIRQSSDFAWLIPPLKRWFSLQETLN